MDALNLIIQAQKMSFWTLWVLFIVK
jgi:hypothetical protein